MIKLVMIVDDEPDLVDFLQEVLESISDKIEVLVASAGEQAKIMIQNHKNDLDLIFIDVVLDTKDTTTGFDVYEFARNLNDIVPIVLMSGKIPMVELSADPHLYFLTKPFTFDDIELLVDKLTKPPLVEIKNPTKPWSA